MIPIKVQPMSNGKKSDRIIYLRTRDDMINLVCQEVPILNNRC